MSTGLVHASLSAQVKFVKGKATMLPPGQMNANVLKKDDIVLEGSSIVTQKKTFVRLVFKDKTSMNIGPESKVVVTNMPKDKANVVNLLTGMIKAKVEKKKKNSKTKFIVKTPSAVLGVRGTKFQSMYNTANKSTSVVTVEGNVALAKAETVNETSLGHVSDSVESLEKTLDNSKSVVEVKAGRYSGIRSNLNTPTVPVKISPTQYDVMAKSMDSKLRAKDVMKPTDGDPDPKGFEDKVNGNIAPKAGGYVDFQTGIYIAPADDAKFDNKTGTFKARGLGKLSRSSGDYIPPKGIKLDSTKGFVLDSEEKSKKLENKLAKLNHSVEKQVHVAKLDEKVKKPGPNKIEKSKWLPENHLLGFSMMPYSEDLSVNIKSVNMEETFSSDSASWNFFSWTQVWNDKWLSRLIVGGVDYQVNKKDYDIGKHDDGGKDDYFVIGVGYKLNPKWTFYADRVERAVHYILPFPYPAGSSSKFAEEQIYELRTMRFSADYFFLNKGKWQYYTNGSLEMFANHQVPSLYYDSMMGYHVPSEEDADYFGASVLVGAHYDWTKTLVFTPSIWVASRSAKSENVEYKRTQVGLNLNLNWDI